MDLVDKYATIAVAQFVREASILDPNPLANLLSLIVKGADLYAYLASSKVAPEKQELVLGVLQEAFEKGLRRGRSVAKCTQKTLDTATDDERLRSAFFKE